MKSTHQEPIHEIPHLKKASPNGSSGNLYVLVGVPGSGKSTVGQAFGTVVSSDDIRAELFGNPALQYEEQAVRNWLKQNMIQEDQALFPQSQSGSSPDSASLCTCDEIARTKNSDQISDAERAGEWNQELSAARLQKYGNEMVFAEVEKRIRRLLQEGKNAVYDATNLTPKIRKSILRRFQGKFDQAIAVEVATDLQEALRRNSLRERQVPESVIRQMYKSYVSPSLHEDFDEVLIIHPDGKITQKSA